MNPAKRPEKGYVGFPGITNFMFDYRTNTFTLDHFLYPGLGKNGKTAFFMNEAISYERFMDGISENNYLNLDLDWTPIGFGFYVKDLFLSFDISLRGKSNVNIPKSYYDFLKRGLNAEEDNISYNFKDVSESTIAFAQMGFGASYPLLDHSLVVGAKAKILLGIANVQVKLDNMHFNFAHDQWTVQSQLTMQSAFPKQNFEYDEDGVLSGIETDGDLSLINGSGLGLDLGVTFTPGKYFDFSDRDEFLNNFTVSAALTDLGYIKWTNNTCLATDPNDILITGGSKSTNIENFGDIFSELGDSFEDMFAFREAESKSSTTGIGAKLNLGVEYAVNDQLNAGFLSSTYFNPVETISECTLAGAYRPTNGFELGLSYSFVYSRFQTFGLALHLGPGFYIAGDYIVPHLNSGGFIPLPTSTKAFNVQLGWVIPIGDKH
jgi:hypothetical protein